MVKKLLVSGVVLTCALAFGMLATPAQAAAIRLTTKHDLSHPVYVGALTAHGFIGMTKATATQHVGPVPVMAIPAPHATPLASNPSWICTNGVAYAQGEYVNGSLVWWFGGQHANATAYSIYYWCPSPWDANGYNFAMSAEWFNWGHGGPLSITIGEQVGPTYHTYTGAFLLRSDDAFFGDGVGRHAIPVGVNQIVYDYSTPQDGAAHYRSETWFYGIDSGAPVFFGVASPYFV